MLFTPDNRDRAAEQTLRILASIGIRVDNEELRNRMKAAGCVEKPGQRICIPRAVIDRLVGRQRESQAEDADVQELYYRCNVDWTHAALWRHEVGTISQAVRARHLISAFDCGPTKYYDYPAGHLVPVDTEIFIRMLKLAQALPEVGYVANWYRSDVNPRTERLESLCLAFQYTEKSAGVESIGPELIPYITEASDILSAGSRDERGTYLAGSQCITPPLFLEDRSARDILERHRCGVHKYHVASMGAIAMSLPVTIAGAVTISAAELLGGLVAVQAVDADARVNCRMIANAIDMKSLEPFASGPEVPLVNLGVKELFDDRFGGHCWVDVFFSPATPSPGLKAVYENFYGSTARTRLSGKTDIPYPGVGTLGNGGVGSPVQLMLDLEIRRSQYLLKDSIEVNEEQLGWEEIADRVTAGGTFLESPTTLARYRELWRSDILSAAAPVTEAGILEACDAAWREALDKRYSYEGLDPNKRRELDKLIARARAELSA